MAASAIALGSGVVGAAPSAFAASGTCVQANNVRGTDLNVRACITIQNGVVSNTSIVTFSGTGNWQDLTLTSNIRDDTVRNTISSRAYNLTSTANNGAGASTGSGVVNAVSGHCYHVYVRITSPTEFRGTFIPLTDTNTPDFCA